MATLHVQIITPEKIIYNDDVDMIVIPGSEGDLGILPHHVPLFTQVRPGELKVKKGNVEFYMAITGGFADITGQEVTILADYAVRAEEIEEKRVEEAMKRAEEAMREKKSETDFALAEADLRRALLELKVASRRKSKKNV
jgi:F-type H+-transporting ATPase subunit epsilon